MRKRGGHPFPKVFTRPKMWCPHPAPERVHTIYERHVRRPDSTAAPRPGNTAMSWGRPYDPNALTRWRSARGVGDPAGLGGPDTLGFLFRFESHCVLMASLWFLGFPGVPIWILISSCFVLLRIL